MTIYGHQQAGHIWSLHLKYGLQRCSSLQSNVDECIYYNKQVILMVYVYNSILLSPNKGNIYKPLQDLQQSLG